MTHHRTAGYDDWLDAVANGEGYYLACPEGHGWLPPRHVCPECGARDLSAEPLPETGAVAASTTVHVAPPSFEGDAPYVTAVADFGAVQVTGQVRGVDPEAVERGLSVSPTVGATAAGDRLLVLEAR